MCLLTYRKTRAVCTCSNCIYVPPNFLFPLFLFIMCVRLHDHVQCPDQDTGDCPERLLRCPLDCVRVNGQEGRRIEVETSPGNYIYCSLRAYNRVENAFKLVR